MPKVSVIIPIYNAECFINRCVDSILMQRYKDFELILVNDGSTDQSDEICKKYEQMDKRIRYVNKTNGGVSSARNEGIKNAIGDYLIFVDSDDFGREEMLEELMKNESADFSMCGYEIYDDLKQSVLQEYQCKELSGDIHELSKRIADYLAPPFLLGPCFKRFKRNIINKYNIQFPVKIAYGEDAIFVLKYLLHCKTVEISPCVGYSYCRHGKETLSRKFAINKIDINYQINRLINQLLEKEKIYERDKIISERLLECFVLYEKELINSNLSRREKKKIFYEKFNFYNKEFGKPEREAQKIIFLAGKNKLCYPLMYLFKFRGEI